MKQTANSMQIYIKSLLTGEVTDLSNYFWKMDAMFDFTGDKIEKVEA